MIKINIFLIIFMIRRLPQSREKLGKDVKHIRTSKKFPDKPNF